MGTYTQAAGGTRFVRLDVPVRAWWSRPRAWHGDALVLHVETAFLPDHTKASLRIYEDGVSPFDDGAFIDERKDVDLVNNRAAVPYTLAWDKDSLGHPLVLHGDAFQFFFDVLIAEPGVRGRSNLLYVHLHPYVVSG